MDGGDASDPSPLRLPPIRSYPVDGNAWFVSAVDDRGGADWDDPPRSLVTAGITA